MKRNLVCKLILLLISSHAHSLSEGLFIEKVLQKTHLFETQAINLEIKEVEFSGDYEYYNNWHYGINGYVSLAGQIQEKDTNYTYTHEEIEYKRLFSNYLTKRFSTNGSNLKISLSAYLQNALEEKYKKQAYSADLNTNESLLSFDINWELPLIRNVSGVLEQTTYDLAKLELQDEKLVFRDFQENTVADYLKIYYELAFLREKISLLEDYIKQLKQIDAYIKKAEFEKKQISYSVLVLAKAKVSLEILISDKLELSKNLEEILSVYEINSIKPDLYLVNKIPHGNVETNSIDLKRIKIEQLKNQRTIRYYKNKLKPEFNFLLNASKAIKKGSYSTYSESHTSDVEVSLNFRYPLGESDFMVKTLLKKQQLNARKFEIKYNSKLQELQEDQHSLQLELQTIAHRVSQIDFQLSQIILLDIKQLSNSNFKESVDNLTKTLHLKTDYLHELFSYKDYLIDFKVLLALLLANSL